jgi:hypothetical protein
LTSPFFFPRRPPNWCVYGLASRAPASIPRRFATVRFISASAAGPVESRINLLHGTPRRRCGMGKTRDWSCHFQFGAINSDRERQRTNNHARAQEPNFLFPSRAHCSHFHTLSRVQIGSMVFDAGLALRAWGRCRCRERCRLRRACAPGGTVSLAALQATVKCPGPSGQSAA